MAIDILLVGIKLGITRKLAFLLGITRQSAFLLGITWHNLAIGIFTRHNSAIIFVVRARIMGIWQNPDFSWYCTIPSTKVQENYQKVSVKISQNPATRTNLTISTRGLRKIIRKRKALIKSFSKLYCSTSFKKILIIA